MNAVTIRFPLSSFQADSDFDWRSPGRYSKELVETSELDKTWKSISRAQDQVFFFYSVCFFIFLMICFPRRMFGFTKIGFTEWKKGLLWNQGH